MIKLYGHSLQGLEQLALRLGPVIHHPPPLPADEEDRLRALRRYRIVDTDPEPQFDRIVDVAKRRFGTPMAFVVFIDFTRLFLKAPADRPVKDVPREASFCGYAILDDEVLVVLDALEDERFARSPFVVGDLKVRFYAGAPLISASGHRVGTICVVDTEPHAEFTERDRQDLADLASIVTDHLEMRAVVGDVHEEIEIRRAGEAKAYELAYHDVLTGLPNRTHLRKIASEGLPFRQRGVLGVFAGDLDGLKAVNDTFGHHVGDELLRRTAARIKAVLGDGAFVARVSGDEFVAIVDGDSREAILSVANDIVEATAAPLPLGGRTISHGVSLGVAFADSWPSNIDALLRDADLALCAAKKAGRRQTAVFDKNMATELQRSANLKYDLIGAIRNETISVLFQPIHSARDATLVGVEARPRWEHPQAGPLSPGEIITLAEEGGQSLDLGDHILRTALRAASEWEPRCYVSVNLSPAQFRLNDLVRKIAAILAATGFPAHRLQLEITESVLSDNYAGAKQQIKALSATGVRLALDDFGAGFSGLDYLAEFPFAAVKIARSVVREARRDRRRDEIVRHIVALGRGLDMAVIAKGVETEDDAMRLTAAGCTALQGEYFGAAMPAAAVAARLRANRSAA